MKEGLKYVRIYHFFDDHLNLFEYLESVLYTNDSLLSYVVSEIPLHMMISDLYNVIRFL